MGYRGFTIRAVASACGIGVGTVYHYYPSKDVLIASVILGDWMEVLARMNTLTDAAGFTESLEGLMQLINDFRRSYDSVFTESRDSLMAPAFAQRHVMLRGQIADILSRLCRRFGRAEDEMALQCASQLILSATTEGWNSEDLLPKLLLLLPAVSAGEGKSTPQ